jgi:hypothetical protein
MWAEATLNRCRRMIDLHRLAYPLHFGQPDGKPGQKRSTADFTAAGAVAMRYMIGFAVNSVSDRPAKTTTANYTHRILSLYRAAHSYKGGQTFNWAKRHGYIDCRRHWLGSFCCSAFHWKFFCNLFDYCEINGKNSNFVQQKRLCAQQKRRPLGVFFNWAEVSAL